MYIHNIYNTCGLIVWSISILPHVHSYYPPPAVPPDWAPGCAMLESQRPGSRPARRRDRRSPAVIRRAGSRPQAKDAWNIWKIYEHMHVWLLSGFAWFLDGLLMKVDDVWMVFGGNLASTKDRLRMWSASEHFVLSLIILDLWKTTATTGKTREKPLVQVAKKKPCFQASGSSGGPTSNCFGNAKYDI